MDLEQKLKKIDDQLKAKIPTGQIKLVAVTKYASDEQILEAYRLGLRDFGENYVMPALEKMSRLEQYFGEDKPRWHLLGKLQSNKVNKAVGKFFSIQSVHSLELATYINERAKHLGIKQKIFLQFNMTGDKNGFDPESSVGTLLGIFKMRHLEVQGLMCMGFLENLQKNETIYEHQRQLKRILESELDSLGLPSNLELSMGMSDDFRIAVDKGSTMIRLGRELFGQQKDLQNFIN